jgi:SlyX protein
MSAELDRRVEDLEVRYAFQEDLLRQLDEVIQQQAARIDALTRELEGLRAQLAQGSAGGNTLQDEKPPHY